MKKQEVRDSKCWTCEFGHCIKQTQREVLFAEAPEPSPLDEDVDHESWMGDLPDFDESEGTPQLGHTHEVEKTGVYGICYWGLTSSSKSDMLPMNVQIIHECNRYEPRQEKPKDL